MGRGQLVTSAPSQGGLEVGGGGAPAEWEGAQGWAGRGQAPGQGSARGTGCLLPFQFPHMGGSSEEGP